MIPRSKILPRRMLGAGVLPLVIAVNVYLASLAIIGGLALLSSADQWTGEIGRLVSVQIAPRGNQNTAALVQSVLQAITAHPTVASARALSIEEIADLLSPWLGDGAAVRDLPVPRLIDVSLKPGADLTALRTRLESAFPGIAVDDHRAWRERMASAMLTTRLVCIGIIALIAFSGVMVIMFATRAGLESHGELVELLHIIGARDAFVAGEFQKHFLGLGIRGAALGLVPVALTLVAIVALLQEDPAPWLSRVQFSNTDYALASLPPVAAVLMTMLTARITVLRALRQMG